MGCEKLWAPSPAQNSKLVVACKSQAEASPRTAITLLHRFHPALLVVLSCNQVAAVTSAGSCHDRLLPRPKLKVPGTAALNLSWLGLNLSWSYASASPSCMGLPSSFCVVHRIQHIAPVVLQAFGLIPTPWRRDCKGEAAKFSLKM